MKRYWLILLLINTLFCFGQLKKNQAPPMTDITSKVNFGSKESGNRTVDIIVVHSTYYVNTDSFSVMGVLSQFKANNVCSHYIIDRTGQIYKTVNEDRIAFHAGISKLPKTDRTNLNTSSIGIEIVNTPHTPPTDAQIQSLVYLVQDIKRRHPIKYVVRHSDIAPGRKTDPWLFPWEVFLKLIEN